MIRLFSTVLVGIATFIAWMSWQPPQLSPDPKPIRTSYEAAEFNQARWLVLTRPIVWKKAADALKLRLQDGGFKPITIQRRETISLHAFDDERTFSRREAAVKAMREWERLDVEATITLNNDRFGVSLGRFYLPEYATRMENKLNALGRPYRYSRKQMEIDVYRYTFAPARQRQAEKLWREIQATGLADPVLMTETRMQTMFKDALVLPD